jgi:hypothetical protein
MDVQVFGDVAVAHGSVTEKRTRDGKEIGGEFVNLNLLKKRAGKWAVVRSAGAEGGVTVWLMDQFFVVDKPRHQGRAEAKGKARECASATDDNPQTTVRKQ